MLKEEDRYCELNIEFVIIDFFFKYNDVRLFYDCIIICIII